MKKWQKIVLAVVTVLVVAATAGAIWMASSVARWITSYPIEERRAFWDEYPFLHPDTLVAEYNLPPYEAPTLVTSDSLMLEALYFPSRNGAALIIQHGHRARGSDMIPMAAMFIRHGYGAILPTLRAHNESDGDLISFGHHELKDLDAAYQYLLERPDVNPQRIGAIGTSMGAALVILYAAENPAIKAVAAESPYHSMNRRSIATLSGLPWPIPSLVIRSITSRIDVDPATLAPVSHIGRISPRPVFIMMGGSDPMVLPEGGQALYDAAGEPRTYWYDEHLDHLGFSQLVNMLIAEPDSGQAAEFESRLNAYFDRYLLGQE
jgi:esterase/lipase